MWDLGAAAAAVAVVLVVAVVHWSQRALMITVTDAVGIK
jgi:hypothetical protein